MCYPDMVWGVLAVAIAFVTSRNTGWINSRLQTSIRRPQTCYVIFIYRVYVHIYIYIYHIVAIVIISSIVTYYMLYVISYIVDVPA